MEFPTKEGAKIADFINETNEVDEVDGADGADKVDAFLAMDVARRLRHRSVGVALAIGGATGSRLVTPEMWSKTDVARSSY
jgi:hypothetical protein